MLHLLFESAGSLVLNKRSNEYEGELAVLFENYACKDIKERRTIKPSFVSILYILLLKNIFCITPPDSVKASLLFYLKTMPVKI